MAASVTDANFKSEVEDFDGVTLVDFWAEWCGPCKIIAPTIDKISKDYSSNGKVKVAKLDVDNNPETAQRFNVMSIPTLLLFKDGQPVKQFVGVRPEPELRDAIDEAVA